MLKSAKKVFRVERVNQDKRGRSDIRVPSETDVIVQNIIIFSKTKRPSARERGDLEDAQPTLQ